MKLVTTHSINGKDLEHLGVVQGSVVRAKDFSQSLLTELKAIKGGELKAYTDLLVESREIAT